MRLLSTFLPLLLVAVCLAAEQDPFSASPPKEPVYRGRTLEDWIALAKDRDPVLRLDAVEVLGHFGTAVIPTLTKLLGDDDCAVCRAAVSALGKIGPEAKTAVPALTGLLKDKDETIRMAAIQALREMGPEAKMAVPTLIELLKGEDAGYEAAATLGAIGPEAKAAVPALTALLKNRKYAREAASALAEIGPEARIAVPSLIELLKEEEGRPTVALALGRIGPEAKEAAAALTKALGDKDVSVRQTAAWALGMIGPESRMAVLALAELLKEKDAWWNAAFALGRIGPASEPAVPVLVEMLKDRPRNRDAVLHALGRIGPGAKVAVPAVLPYIKKRDSLDRSDALWALGKIRPQTKDAISVLAGLLKDKKEGWGQRQIVASVLVKIGDASIPTFMELLTNQDEQTQFIAIWGLGEIGPDANIAVPALTQLLRGGNGSVRLAATRALGKIGPKAQAAIPFLTEVLKDKDVLLRWSAIKALSAIGLDARTSAPALTDLLADKSLDVRDAAAAVLGTGQPKVKLPAAEARRIRGLIADLAKISDEGQLRADFGNIDFAPTASIEPFRTRREQMQMPKPDAAFAALAEIGPVAIPFLLESLNDKTPSKLTLDNRSSVYGMWLRHELPGNALNSREAKIVGDEDLLTEDMDWYERQLAWYNVTVGDICLAVIGQITNRPYKPVESMKVVHLTSPVEDPRLAEQLRAMWGESDHRQKLLESLLVDMEPGSEFQDGAAMRLAYYFPDAADDLIIARLDELESAAMGAHPCDFSVTLEEMVTQAVAWSKSPRLRAKMLEICRKTKNGKVLLAAMPAVGKEHDELVFRRLVEQLDAVPKENPQWWEEGGELLRAAAKRFPDRAEDVFRDFLKPGTVSRFRTAIRVLEYGRDDLAIRLLPPLLDDRRVAYKTDRIVVGTPQVVLVCDEAAKALATHLKMSKFDKEGPREHLDRQIDTIRRTIAEMKPPK